MADSSAGSERFIRGEAAMRRLTGGDPALSRAMAQADEVTPDLARLVVEFVFGELYSRPGLDPQRRHLVTLSCLISLGETEELRVHLGLALNTGLSPDEIVEAILHTAAYVGFPRAVAATRVAREVFIDKGIIGSGDQ
ncbi:carboxymuconolactone decarboxylase family protein [Amycolatopsis ultiminotia]|uniref:Carboxymuconolactone decarboxylase family protein n=1 Tax=Amycolatopsis ultiminotia TaxID=543629 RepID=A0ABP6W5N3_9PSEU